MRRLPSLAAVRVFEAAARHLNFTAAAAELGMTQAAVSYQIRLLEERLGAPLFVRERGRVTLTTAARRASAVVSSAFDALGDAFSGIVADDAAVLRISCANSFATAWLAPRVGAFQLAQPALAVRIDATDRMADFARDEVDVGIRAGVQAGAGLHATRLFPVVFTPMASPGFLATHPLVDPRAMLDAPRLTPGDPWWGRWFASLGIEAGDPPAAGLQLDSQVAEGSAAMAGAGVALLNPLLWRRELADGRLVAPFDHTASYGGSFWLVCAEARRNVPKIKAFRDWLVAAAADD